MKLLTYIEHSTHIIHRTYVVDKCLFTSLSSFSFIQTCHLFGPYSPNYVTIVWRTDYLLIPYMASTELSTVGNCSRLNICISPILICWNLIPNMVVFRGGGLGRCLGHEDGTLLNGIHTLSKRHQGASSPFWYGRMYGKDRNLGTRKWPWPDTKICQHLNLGHLLLVCFLSFIMHS